MALLFGFAIKASADDYPLNFTNVTKSARLYSKIILNSKFYGEQTINATIDNTSSPARQNLYQDLTSQKFYCVAGEQLTASFTKGSSEDNFWLNGYIYIDDDKNGQFEYGVNSADHKPTGDLYAYSFYTESTSSDETGYNSAGQQLTGYSRSTHNPPSFVAPTVPGVYRMRYKADWCSIDPGGDTNNTFGGTFTTYKGSIFDVTLVVVGYCNVSSAATGRDGKLHSDYNYINSKHSFLAANTESTNNFIWKIEPADATGLKFNLTSGQGFPLMLLNGTTPSLTFNTRTSTGAIYFTEAVNASKDLYADGDTKRNKKALTTWTGHPDAADNQWVFTKIDGIENEVGYVYSVNITKSVESLDISNARITKTATSELAFNGGFFYCTTAPTASEFTAFEIENTTSTIVVDENAKTITVTYSEAAVYITDTEIAEAQALRDLAGKVGYPSLTSNAYSTFNTFVSSLSTSTTTVAAYTAAVNAFKTATDIALPEDGKAYKIKCQAKEWSAYVKYGEVGTGKITLVGSTTADTHETTFICHEISAGNYLFVDNAGRYLKWVCDQDARVYDATGEHATTYNSTYNVLSLARASVDANGGRISNDVKNTDFFGRIEIKGTRANGTTQSYLNMRHKDSDGENYKFISEAGLERYYDTDGERRSHTFIFEETEYPNVVTLTQATGIDDGTKKIATFSAPFAFTLPAGVDAYVVAQTPQSNTAKMEAHEYAGRAVAANTGVILYGATSETQVRMIPAASNGTSAQSNMLGNSAGGPKQIVDVPGQTNYILAKKGGNVVFSRALPDGENDTNKSLSMNKAYLSIPTASGVNQFVLGFGEDGPTTGICSLEAGNAGSAAAPLYDLSGRRISQPATRGIYIRGGKKFMVK